MKQYIEHDLVMLPTKEKSNIHSYMYDLSLLNTLKETYQMNGNSQISYAKHLYITSNDEIKEGDWVFDPIGNRVAQIREVSKKGYNFGAKKIIATTDSSLWEHDDTVPYPKTRPALPQISQEFIEYFVEEYNKGNIITKVLIEYKEDVEQTKVKNSKIPFSVSKYHPDNSIYTPVINPDNTINIKSVEVKMYSREEVIKLMNKSIDIGYNYCKNDRPVHTRTFIDKWIEENL